MARGFSWLIAVAAGSAAGIAGGIALANSLLQ